jgi:flagellar assembly protein FliH
VALQQPFAELDAAVEEQVSQLAMLVARHLVRRELKADPGQVVAVVREALAALPITSRSVRLHLHPEDAQLVRQAFSLNEQEAHIQVLDDPVQSRGGCRVQTDNSQIDATVETRLNALIARVLGGEREEDVAP